MERALEGAHAVLEVHDEERLLLIGQRATKRDKLTRRGQPRPERADNYLEEPHCGGDCREDKRV